MATSTRQSLSHINWTDSFLILEVPILYGIAHDQCDYVQLIENRPSCMRSTEHFAVARRLETVHAEKVILSDSIN